MNPSSTFCHFQADTSTKERHYFCQNMAAGTVFATTKAVCNLKSYLHFPKVEIQISLNRLSPNTYKIIYWAINLFGVAPRFQDNMKTCQSFKLIYDANYNTNTSSILNSKPMLWPLSLSPSPIICIHWKFMSVFMHVHKHSHSHVLDSKIIYTYIHFEAAVYE